MLRNLCVIYPFTPENFLIYRYKRSTSSARTSPTKFSWIICG